MTILHQILHELEFIKYKIDLLEPRKNLKIKNLVRSAREKVSCAIAEIKSEVSSKESSDDFNKQISKEMFK